MLHALQSIAEIDRIGAHSSSYRAEIASTRVQHYSERRLLAKLHRVPRRSSKNSDAGETPHTNR
jgi:hypothetical protein